MSTSKQGLPHYVTITRSLSHILPHLHNSLCETVVCSRSTCVSHLTCCKAWCMGFRSKILRISQTIIITRDIDYTALKNSFRWLRQLQVVISKLLQIAISELFWCNLSHYFIEKKKLQIAIHLLAFFLVYARAKPFWCRQTQIGQIYWRNQLCGGRGKFI